ncbi:cyclase family protein [Pseudonocardia ailaonensis]|uniref:Cyclase family protein n=1 Tax=Pseudonocardia ailaonensis TaxID=367279 RepID=A0ABN2N9T5_9PSEU
MSTPKFADLPEIAGERHAWDVWGRDDELGSLNRVGPAEILAATQTVRDGTVVPLTLPLDEPDPGLFERRTAFEHVVETTRNGRDDKVDNLWLQFSSQWDGLRHVRFREHGYWGGRQEEDLDAGDALGIDRWSVRGPMGRGVLVDVARFHVEQGRPWAPDEAFDITPAVIEEVAAAQGVTFRPGDFLILRTGWVEWYRAQSPSARAAMRGSVGNGLACPGLDSARETAEFLWDNGFASVAADNIACERLPVDRGKGFLHRRVIPLLGMAIGEFWELSGLSEACAAAGRHEFLLVSAALRIPRGVGSPANAYAVL